MERSEGRREIAIGLIDGPVALDHPDLEASRVRAVRAEGGQACSTRNSAACLHGTFVAGILVGRRGSVAPAICPGCMLLARPIFAETTDLPLEMPSASPAELVGAITNCMAAGANAVNLRLAVVASPNLWMGFPAGSGGRRNAWTMGDKHEQNGTSRTEAFF
jgi:subtilisin family serine protease